MCALGRQRGAGLVIPAALLLGGSAAFSAENVIRIGQAQGRPGETVRLPVHVTNVEPVALMQISWAFDSQVLVHIDPSIGGTACGDLPVDVFSHRLRQEGWGQATMETDAISPIDKYLPPGQEQIVLWIRFRIRSSAPAGETMVHCQRPEEVLGASALASRGGQSLAFRSEDGKIRILEPEGLRPPELASCAQVVSRVDLRWESAESYDAILVYRDDEQVASLPGGANHWADQAAPRGRHDYSIAGVRGSEESVAAACEVLVGAPKVPAIEGLACVVDRGSCSLAWASETVYDRIVIERDGALLAELGGTTRSFVDAAAPPSATLYEVVGYVEGYVSPAARCVIHGSFAIRVGDVRADPGQTRVRVPVYSTTMEPLQGTSIGLPLPIPWIGNAAFTVEGTVSEAIGNEGVRGFVRQDGLALGVYHDYLAPIGPTLFPPSIDALVCQLVFDLSPDVPEGTAIPIVLGEFVAPPVVYNTMVAVGGISIRPRLVPGQILVGGTGVASVQGLEASRMTAGKGPSIALLTWRNGEAYDRIVLERNGEVVAELPGGATKFVDSLDANQVYHYRVKAFRADRPSFPASITFTTLPSDVVFRRGDANADGRVNIADAIALVEALFSRGAGIPCDDAADADDSGALNLADPVRILNYLFTRGSAPPCPGPNAAGLDPTPDPLRCR